jgi:hypothetical protein
LKLKSNLLDCPAFSILAVPNGPERDAARFLQNNLLVLSSYTQQFEQAVRLADHVDELRAPWLSEHAAFELAASKDPSLISELREKHSLDSILASWCGIAARDAAMTVMHFVHILVAIIEGTKAIPTLLAFVDVVQLDAAKTAFERDFPTARLMRNAVGHSSERASSPKEVRRESLSKPYRGPGIDTAGSNITFTLQSARTLQMTWKKEVFEISVDEDTLDKLIAIQMAIFAVFRPAVEALRGVDLGD